MKSPETLKIKDNIDVKVGVDKSNRKLVCEGLSRLLASTYLLNLKTLYYHWNVTGANFVGLHQLFEQQYTGLAVASDDLAERVRALGHFTPGTVTEFITLSSVKDDSIMPKSSSQMVENLLLAHEQCSKEARSVLEIAEDANDEVTVDMMVARMNAHDKNAWMLRAILE